MPDRVVITGYGAVTPVGLTVEQTWQSLVNGIAGINKISLFDANNFIVQIAAEVKDFDPVAFMDPVTAKYSDRFTQFAIASSRQAITMANLTIDDNNRYDIGIIIGSGIGGIGSIERQLDTISSRGPSKVSPFTVPMMIADNASGNVSIKNGIKGMNISLVSSCSTGTDAIGLAYKLIKYGEYKYMIAGGTDAAITPTGVAGFTQAGALSKNPDPESACRPFDAKRDGFVIGEGAGVLVLESMDSAKSRGAEIFAEIVGYGATSDAYHITKPSETGESAAKAIAMALQGIDYGEVDYINAHGTSTPLNDVSETNVIKKVFGSQAYKIPVSSIKSMVGHMLGAAGAVEAIICCKVIQEGIIPPTVNYQNCDASCDLDYVPNIARKCDVNTVVSNSFGFGGHNSVLVLRKVLLNSWNSKSN
jgi:3-oxoacyl-[acyl-carrier-protein] synthase II